MKVKNLFLSMLAVAGMLAVASCSQDDFLGGKTAGDYVDATFTVSTADGIGTRATIGNGETVNKVACTVYDANGAELDLYQIVDVQADKTATYNVRLAKGQAYRVAFFAYYGDENGNSDYYTVNDLKNIEVKEGQLSNIEERDAFTANYEVTKEMSMNSFNNEEPIQLKRPFAQLNLGIDAQELEAARKSGIVISESEIKVSNVYNAFSAYHNAVVKTAVAAPMTFKLNAIPTEMLEVELNGIDGIQDDEKFTYLAMNYLLVGDLNSEKTLTDVEFIWATADGKTNDPITIFPNIRTQRNYRTNILGKLITNPAKFNLIIDARFINDKNMGYIFNDVDLQAAIDAAPVGETTTIYLAQNFKGSVTDVQKADRHIIIDGRGVKFDGSIKVSNGSEYNNGSITIKNINFETATEGLNFIEGLEAGSNNITVEACTFTATGAAVNTAVGVNATASKNLKVVDCTANDMNSLLQAQNCDENVEVVNATIDGCENGVAFSQVKNALVEGTTIDAAGYGIRFDGDTDNYGITVKNSDVTAKQPLIVRKMTAQDNTITLENSTFTVATSRAADAAFQVIITNGNDDEAYSKPTGTYTLTGADDLLVYPRDSSTYVASWEEFAAAVADGDSEIILTDDIEYTGNFDLENDVIIDLAGNSIKVSLFNVFSTSTIKNGTIEGKMYVRRGCDATLEDLTFSGAISDHNKSTDGHLTVQDGCDVYAKNCVFDATTVSGTNTNALSIEAASSGTRKFENCDFKFRVYGFGTARYKKEVSVKTMSGTTTVDFTDCKFNGKSPYIQFATSCPLTNLTMSGCDNTTPIFEVNRRKNAVSDAEWDHIDDMIANNSFRNVKVYYDYRTNETIGE